MKIINLSFSNINSLAGFWSIDFTTPAFSDGLFVLTGPTGAGKTSVLDAICLALYGKTVREEQISKEIILCLITAGMVLMNVSVWKTFATARDSCYDIGNTIKYTQKQL